MASPRISVITPTFNRERHLPNLVACFQQQTCGDLELLILDDSSRPSPLMQAGGVDDPRVRYIHSPQRMTIGAKRNRLVEESRGEVIVQFDDDDYYAPQYVATMVGHLEGNDLVKLGAWFGFSRAKRQFFYWDTTVLSSVHFVVGPSDPLVPVSLQGNVEEAEFVSKNLWGYGFSYVVKKRVFEKHRFAEQNWGEDYLFTQGMLSAGLKLHQVPDAAGLALHVIHGSNTSRTFPQYLVPRPIADHLFGNQIAAYLDV